MSTPYSEGTWTEVTEVLRNQQLDYIEVSVGMPMGPSGPPGEPGPPGERAGSTWFNGEGPPSLSDEPVPGDYYLDSSTGDVYEYILGNDGFATWQFLFSMGGSPTGAYASTVHELNLTLAPGGDIAYQEIVHTIADGFPSVRVLIPAEGSGYLTDSVSVQVFYDALARRVRVEMDPSAMQWNPLPAGSGEGRIVVAGGRQPA